MLCCTHHISTTTYTCIYIDMNMSRKNTWSRCHVCGGVTRGQGFAAEMSSRKSVTYIITEDERTTGTKVIKHKRQLRASQTRYTRGGTEGLRKHTEEDRERRVQQLFGLLAPFPQCLPQLNHTFERPLIWQ